MFKLFKTQHVVTIETSAGDKWKRGFKTLEEAQNYGRSQDNTENLWGDKVKWTGIELISPFSAYCTFSAEYEGFQGIHSGSMTENVGVLLALVNPSRLLDKLADKITEFRNEGC